MAQSSLSATEDGEGSCSDPLLPRVEFDSDLYPEPERSAAYQQVVAGPAKLTPQEGRFHARIVGYVAGPIRFHAVDASPHLFERSAQKASMDSADYLAVQHIVEGEVEGDCDGRPVHAAAGSIYVMNFRQPMTLLEKANTRLRFVTVNRTAAVARFGDLTKLHGLVIGAGQASSYLRFLDGVYPELLRTRRSEVRGLASQTLAELAKLFGIEPDLPAEPTLAERAKTYIEDHLDWRDLTPERVARALDVSRSQLYVPFQTEGGVARYMWKLRLAQVHAALMLSGDPRSLTQLAYDHGFSNQAHMSSLFRRTYGVAPSKLRQNRPNA